MSDFATTIDDEGRQHAVLHAVRQDLPGGADLLARPGDRRLGQRPHVEPRRRRSCVDSEVDESPAPTLVDPGQRRDGRLAFRTCSGSPLAYAASYDVQIDNDANFSSPITTTTTKMTAWAYTEPLAAGHLLLAGAPQRRRQPRRRMVEPVRSFVLAPAAPTLVSPANGANPSPATLLLQWTSSQPAPKYTVELSTSAAFAVQVSGFPVTTVMTSWAPKTLLGERHLLLAGQGAQRLGDGRRDLVHVQLHGRLDAGRASRRSARPAAARDHERLHRHLLRAGHRRRAARPSSSRSAGTATALPGHRDGPLADPGAVHAGLAPGARPDVHRSPSAAAITDMIGNPLLPYSANVRTSTTVQQDSPAVSEAWARWSTGSASGGAMKLSRTASTKLTFTFTGSSISLVGYRGPSGGYGSVYLDGVLRTSSLSFYASSSQYRRTLWSATGLAAGTHKLEILPARDEADEVEGHVGLRRCLHRRRRHGPGERGRRRGALPEGDVVLGLRSAYDLTSHVEATGRSGPALTFQFKGTGITWYGTKGRAYGKAVRLHRQRQEGHDRPVPLRHRLQAEALDFDHALERAAHDQDRRRRDEAVGGKGYNVSFDYFAIK